MSSSWSSALIFSLVLARSAVFGPTILLEQQMSPSHQQFSHFGPKVQYDPGFLLDEVNVAPMQWASVETPSETKKIN